MAPALAVRLAHRGVLAVAGDDRRTFLQGLVSNDVARATGERAIWSAFLTPQGKFLHDLFLVEQADRFLLDCEAAERAEDLRKRLSLYKLRAKVTVGAAPEFGVFALLGDDLGLMEPGAARSFGGGIAFVDPRLPQAGLRAILPLDGAERVLAEAGFAAGSPDDYDRLRISLGLPDGSRDMTVDKALLLENGFEELNGVDFQKGCYMGQELTARTKYRGLVKKRLMPVHLDGPAPAAGTPLMLGEQDAGEMRSSCGDVGLALVRLEHLKQARRDGLNAGETRIRPWPAEWMRVNA